MDYFNCIMEIGEQMLISGAEVHRVEESIRRMAEAFGAQRVDVFIITSSMVVTVHSAEGESHTQTRRITATGTDYEKLHKLNDLSREICEKHLSLEEITEKLNNSYKSKKFPAILELICYALIAGAFTIFFGGNLKEAAISLGIGFCVRLLVFLSEKIIKNNIFLKFFSMVIVTFLAFLSVKIGILDNADEVIIGNVMPLIPGVGFTNALRDLFTGDSIAAVLRFIEAILTAVSIAAGYFLVTVFGGYIL